MEEVLENGKNKNRRILPVGGKSSLKVRDAEFLREEMGNKTTVLRKIKCKRRNTNDDKIFGK